MFSASVLVVVLLGVLAALVIMGVGWVTFTRYAGEPLSAHAPIPCGYRGGEHQPWTGGALSYDGHRLVHHDRRAGTEHRWKREGLDMGYAESLPPGATPGLPAGMDLSVPCRYGDTAFTLAMTQEHYTALRSWVEAAPPGWNSNVA